MRQFYKSNRHPFFNGYPNLHVGNNNAVATFQILDLIYTYIRYLEFLILIR